MPALPNVNVPLVGEDRRPTRALLGVFPDLSSDAEVVDCQGVPTAFLRTQLQAIGGAIPTGPVVNVDGTATRPMTALLQRLA